MFPLKTLGMAVVLLAAPSFAQPPAPPPSPAVAPDIIVTGTSLKAAKAALADCIAQHCPPDHDIDATLAVAETQFVAGAYKDARATMLKSIARNHRYAKTYPVPVSDLLRANSRVSAHLGETTAYFSGALDVLSALKSGLPDTDYRVLGAQTELGDAYAKTGRIDAAVDLYRRVARRAHTLALPRVEGYALLRVATVYAAASDQRGDTAYGAARAASDALIANPDPALAPYARAATLLKAELAVKHGDAGAIDRLIATYRDIAGTATRPVLLFAPKIVQTPLSGRESAGGETLNQVPMDDFDDQWVDIGFQIAPAGTVTDAEILRQSPRLSGYWVKPILTAISGRRYAPLAADNPGALRVERYSFTASWTTVTGTRLRVRSPIPRIEVVDLSRDPASKTP